MATVSSVGSSASALHLRQFGSISAPSVRRLAITAMAAVGAAASDMTFIEHLEELRRRILWSLVAVIACFGFCWLAAPIILTQVWLFIAPGLYPHERRYAIPFVLSASGLFLAGGAFGYLVAFPTALGFLLDWIVASQIAPIIDAVEYFDLFFTITVALGIVFQIPAVIFVLSRIGIVTAGLLVRYFKHAILGCMIVAAVITPTTDFANMLLIAGPMILLYGVGIGVAWVFGRRRRIDVTWSEYDVSRDTRGRRGRSSALSPVVARMESP